MLQEKPNNNSRGLVGTLGQAPWVHSLLHFGRTQSGFQQRCPGLGELEGLSKVKLQIQKTKGWFRPRLALL